MKRPSWLPESRAGCVFEVRWGCRGEASDRSRRDPSEIHNYSADGGSPHAPVIYGRASEVPDAVEVTETL